MMYSRASACFFICLTVSSTVSTKRSCVRPLTKDGCNLSGEWKNELGSVVVFSCQDGQISGNYSSAVGKVFGWYNLTGSYTMAGVKHDVTIASWVVSWNNGAHGNSESSSTWNGILYPDDESLNTIWTLVRYTDKKDYWDATSVGKDQFWRIC